MITISEWNEMSGKEQTLWLEDNCQVNGRGCPRKPVHGVGINDAHYCTRPSLHGVMVRCPAYMAWISMLARSYSANYQERRPTYFGVTVCNAWHSFMEFRCWWIEHYVNGFHLDKDLLSDARLYSPNTCIFVPQWLNSFTTDRRSARGGFPIGVDLYSATGKFRATCRNTEAGIKGHLGYFDTPEEAHLAWRTRKLELALELKPKMDSIDLRIYPRVVEIINNAR